MISHANVPLMRKHAADILHGTDMPDHFATFLNMDRSSSISHKRTSPVTGGPSHFKCRYMKSTFLSRVKFHLGLHTIICSMQKGVTGSACLATGCST